MKKIKYISLATLAVAVTLSCTKSEFDDFEPTISGGADFSVFVSVGNSLTQGFQDGGLHNDREEQTNSFPAILARQMGTTFLQPMVEGAGSGYNALEALGASPTLADVAPESQWGASGWSEWDRTIQYNNLGIAGVRLTDCVPTAGDPFSPTINQGILSLNPFGGYLDYGGLGTPISYLDHVRQSNATFFTNWLGNNDVLSHATNGGTNGEVTVNGVTINTSDLTPVSVFRNKYDSVLTAFQNMGANGVCATIPDVTTIPFFTTVPHNPVPLDQATIDLLMNGPGGAGGGFADYNAAMDGLALVGIISADEASQRRITLTVGANNPILITDEALTVLTGLPSGFPPALPSIRQATAEDLILLTSSASIGQVISQTEILGVSVPFDDELVLTATEIAEIVNHTDLLNNELRASAAAHNFPVVDMHGFLGELQSGLIFDGVDYAADYILGGAFSLDGIHPNQRGYAIIANEFIRVINANYGSNLRPVSPQNFRGITFP